jgi:alpha-beta hydrolase superfamily lysophospholipase
MTSENSIANKPADQRNTATPRKTVIKIIAWLVIAGFFLFNAVAYMHAYRMTHFVETGRKTSRPEALSLSRKITVLLTGVTIPKPRNTANPASQGMPYSECTFITQDNIRLSAWSIPGKPGTGTILMFHGYGSCKSRLLPEARVFHELGWNILMTDFRGSGDSDGYTTTIGLREAEDVSTAVKWVMDHNKNKPVVLFGVSMGAAAILRAINTELVKPDAIIMECPFDKLLTTAKHRFEAMNVPSFPAAHFLVFWGGIQNGFNGFSLNPVDYAKSVTCPALVMQGTDDPRVKGREALSVCARLSGSKTFHVFSGPGHESYCVSMPDEYHSVISHWMSTRFPSALQTGAKMEDKK